MNYLERAESGRRLVGLITILALHVVVIYALVHGLARKTVEVVHNPIEAKIVEEVKAPLERPPPPAPPKLTPPPPVYIPPPQVTVQAPVPPPPVAAVTTVKPAEPAPAPAAAGTGPPASAGTGPPEAPPGPPKAVVRTAAVVDAKSCREPPYPLSSRRDNETGIVRLSIHIDVDGTVLDSKVERSSGYRRLDEAARAGLALCKFKPATVDGKAVRSWEPFAYEWKLQ